MEPGPVSNELQPATGPLSQLTLPQLPALAKPVVGTPVEVYTRVAHGAVTCWFGSDGPLKGGYVYHAEADPPSRGGRSSIVIHELDKAAQDLRGTRTFSVGIIPEGDSAKLDIQDLKMPKPLGQRMVGDVRRWAGDEAGCAAAPLATGWTADGKAQSSNTANPETRDQER